MIRAICRRIANLVAETSSVNAIRTSSSSKACVSEVSRSPYGTGA